MGVRVALQTVLFFFGPIQHIEGFSVLSNDTEMAGILKES